MSAPLRIVQVASLGNLGDNNIYRVHQPRATLALLPGVQTFEVQAQSRWRDAVALAAGADHDAGYGGISPHPPVEQAHGVRGQ